ncbi:MAG TPA: pitrilysin family protein [Gammaproteobacteria bacterium]|nr:pitrilysin family protein [Gammaproteobacteria bacterium]
MRISKLLVFLTLFTTAFAAAAADGGHDRNVLRAQLKNGLRVVIVRDTLAPVATVEMNYLVGAVEAPAKFPGLAHAQEHMMFRGSPGLTAAQLADITAALGGASNAQTQPVVTRYYFTVPSADLPVALHIGALRMTGVLDTTDAWQQERGAIEQEVARDTSDPQYLLYTRLLHALFTGTPYASTGLGTRPSFDKLTAARLKQFHDQWYVPNNAVLVIAGKVDPDKTLDTIKQLFGDIPAHKLPPRPKIKLQPVKSQTLHAKTDRPYGLVTLAFRFPATTSHDFAAAEVLGAVLSSPRGKLYALRPEGKALAAGFSYTGMKDVGMAYAAAAFAKGQDSKALVKSVKSILQDIVTHGVDPDLVAAAKRHALTGAETRKNSISGLAGAWSEAVAVEGLHSPADWTQAIEQVNVADVNRVARQYLDLNHMVVAVLTPQASGKALSSKGFGGKESFTPKNPKPVELPKWAREALAKLVVPEPIVHPTVTTLDNGIKLIVQPESVSRTVSVYGQIRTNPDLEVPKGQEGIAGALDRLFDFGTQKLNRLQFERALDDIGASESAGASFSLLVLAKDFDHGVELLAANELHPALPKRAFTIAKMQAARHLAGVLQSPGYHFQRAVTEHLVPKGDPALRQATPQGVMSLKLADAVDYYHKAFRPDLTTIVVIGDIDPKHAEAVIKKYFGGWQAKGKPPKTHLPPIPPNDSAVVHVPDKSRVQDHVALEETLGLTLSDKDRYALWLGNAVLGGGFASRLFHDLRTDAGLVYSVGSSFSIGKTRSTFSIGYGADPDKVAKARALALHDVKLMQTQAVDKDELHRAQAMLLRSIALEGSSISAIGGGLLQRGSEDLPLHEPVIAAHRYVGLSAEDVQKAFKKWIRPDGFVTATEGPKPGGT